MRTLAYLLLPLALASSGCTSKVSQCNRLIEVINQHTASLATAIESLAKIEDEPQVADTFANVVEDAQSAVSQLELRDPQVAQFATDYQALLSEAKNLGVALKAAAGDEAKREEVIASADKVVSMEDKIVQSVNTYCQAR